MKKLLSLVILISMGITQIYAQTCYQCNNTAFRMGSNSTANGQNSFAGGNSSRTDGNNSFAFGLQAKALQDYGIAIGNYVISNALNSYVFGIGASSYSPLTNSKANSIMFGVSNLPTLTIWQPQNAALGYLGIGTDAPEEQVHVAGKLLIDCTDANIQSRLRFKYIDLSGSSRLDPYWDMYSDIEGLKFSSVNAWGISTQRINILGNGNVGIGVTNPQAKLDVAGSFTQEKVIVNKLVKM